MIPMSETHIDIEETKHKVVSGGILPICIDECGSIKVLLGRERYIPQWRGSLKWSGFEGGRKFEDTSILHMASREFIEESMGALHIGKHVDTTVDSIMEILETDQYFARVLLCINHNENRTIEQRFHVTYIVQFPYQRDAPQRFSDIRRDFLHFQNKLTQFQRIMTQIVWEHPFIREEFIMNGKKVKAMTDIFMMNGELIITYLDEDGTKKLIINENDVSCKERTAYLKWYALRLQIHSDIETLLQIPQSIYVERNCLGFFVNAKVNDEYLEKMEIDWWTLEDLKLVLMNKGNLRNHSFRAYFLPVLQRAIQELDKYNQRYNY